MTDTAGSADGPRILAGSPTEEEAAAIAAVFAQLLLERAAARSEVPPERVRSAWERSVRPLRHWDREPDRSWRDA